MADQQTQKTATVTAGADTDLLLVGGALVLGYFWFKSKQQSAASGTNTATASSGTLYTGGKTVSSTASATHTTPYTPASPSQSSASLVYSASTVAPSISFLKLASYNQSTQTAVLTWTGAQATWADPNGNLADNTGYNLYQISDGTPTLMATEVEPPLYVPGVASGTVLGIAPTYLTAGGREITGQLVTVTVS